MFVYNIYIIYIYILYIYIYVYIYINRTIITKCTISRNFSTKSSFSIYLRSHNINQHLN